MRKKAKKTDQFDDHDIDDPIVSPPGFIPQSSESPDIQNNAMEPSPNPTGEDRSNATTGASHDKTMAPTTNGRGTRSQNSTNA